MSILVVHTVFGFGWDEIASIVGVLAAVFGAIAWLSHSIGHVLNKNVNKPISSLDTSVNDLRHELHKHAETSSETLIKMQDKDNNFESRISYLEKIVGRFLKDKL